jgi:hypothetical protein
MEIINVPWNENFSCAIALAQIKNNPARINPVYLNTKIKRIKINRIYKGIFRSILIFLSLIKPKQKIIIPNNVIKTDIQKGKKPEEILETVPILYSNE